MTQYFETRQWVPFPVERVFAFFANPRNLPRLMPPELQSRIEDVHLVPPLVPPQSMAIGRAKGERLAANVFAGVGSKVTVNLRPIKWLPLRVSWLARIVAFEWNSQMIDEQVRGPFAKFHHRHATQPELRNGVEGTEVCDQIEYTLPYGILSRPANSFVRKELEHSFEWRQQRLAQILTLEARVAEAQVLRETPTFLPSVAHRDPSHYHPQ
jgi:ligand-binding SRPBCC domain-containing protein